MKLTAKEISLVAMFAALTSVAAILSRFSLIVIPFTQVPFSLVPFVVLLAGMILGPRLGALSITVYAIMGLIGIPVFESPMAGPAYILKPTFGFILGFIMGAYVTGTILPRQGSPTLARYLAASLAGIAAIYIVGLPYLYLILNFYLGNTVPVMQVLKIGFIPYIGFDLIKGVLASFLSMAVVRRLKASGMTDINRA
ncbi:MAG: biotin biosynthesis protein BioY [Peptococcaceae bacterium BICA1-7]|nr:MAG: biotin biosynthesis protein BioY [Peptococcaceae bacterium BICA1-7]HBV96198.1 biotin transporter BioY [Desulfotomaculum sp.]